MNVFFWRSILTTLGDRHQKTFTSPDYSSKLAAYYAPDLNAIYLSSI